MSLTITAQPAVDNVARLLVEGEVDVANAQDLTNAFDELLANDAIDTIEVDMAGVPYIDSTGIGVLMAASKKAEEKGYHLKVSNPQRPVLRVFTLLGVVSEFNIENGGER